MKHLSLPLIGMWIAAISMWACISQPVPSKSKVSQSILINQVGYPTLGPKKALLRGPAQVFQLKDATGKVVFQDSAAAPRYWELSGDSVRVADFSAFTQKGSYTLCTQDGTCTQTVSIGDSLYHAAADAALKSYFYARCSEGINEAHGGQWQRKAGHPDTAVVIHKSAASNTRPAGLSLALPGGWYDAGDYGKYVVNSGITTWTLLQSLQSNLNFHQGQSLNIPESGNELPDILDETLVNLRWMLSMQDPHDGGVYHKLTTERFGPFIMPEETQNTRYLFAKSTAAALDFAATMAAASRVLQTFPVENLAEQTQQGAEKAWRWALQHPEDMFQNPDGVNTGMYPDTSLIDEWFWAAAELYVLTGKTEYEDRLLQTYHAPVTPKWDVVQALGAISLLSSPQRKQFPQIEADFLAYIDLLLQKEKNCPYLISMDKFAWGSNSDVANDGMLKLIAYRLSGKATYLKSAQNDLDYILGRNATGYSFVTGFGHRYPRYPHNRIIAADGIEEPIPGYLAGGPNTIVPNDCKPKPVKRSTYPAASYVDEECSFSTNETAINWNAPLVFLLSGLSELEE